MIFEFRILLILLLFSTGMGLIREDLSFSKPVIWIFKASEDQNTILAESTLLNELSCSAYIPRTEPLTMINHITIHSQDIIIILGHGTPEGLETKRGIEPWTRLYEAINSKQPEIAIVLACHSPSDISTRIFGFETQIDAEAGALLVGWYLNQIIDKTYAGSLPFTRITYAQEAMNHPLGSITVFVHGYNGNDYEFDNMITYLEQTEDPSFDVRYDDFGYFDYFKSYPGWSQEQVNNLAGGISTFAIDFYDMLISTYPTGTQIDIVAHSLGGLITREMLRLRRTDLENSGIMFGRVITLGSPHLGTYSEVIAFFLGFLFPDWDTLTTRQLIKGSSFLDTLNSDPESYQSGIEWHTIAGVVVDYWTIFASIYLGGNDGMVGEDSAHGQWTEWDYTRQMEIEHSLFTGTAVTLERAHGDLIHNSEQSYVNSLLGGLVDTDGDGMPNAWEILYTPSLDPQSDDAYQDADGDGLTNLIEFLVETDPTNPDCDDDSINDYEEIYAYNTDPNKWDTDDDGMSDAWEVTYLPVLDPTTADATADPDDDTYTNFEEYCWDSDPTTKNAYVSGATIVYYTSTSVYTVMHFEVIFEWFYEIKIEYKINSGSWVTDTYYSGYYSVGSHYRDEYLYSRPSYGHTLYMRWSIINGVGEVVDQIDYSDYIPATGGGGGGRLP